MEKQNQSVSQSPSITIQQCKVFDDCAKLGVKYGQGCNYPTGYAVDGFQVDYDVLIDNGIEQKTFHLVMQSMERTDGIMAYNGVEMTPARAYGVDNDETNEAYDFIEENDNLVADDMLRVIYDDAESRCRDWFNEHIADLLTPFYSNNDEEKQDDLSLADNILKQVETYGDLFLMGKEQVESVILFLCEQALKDHIKGDFDYSFSVSDNPTGYENLVDRAMALVDEDFNSKGEVGLSDEELLANLDDEDLVFVNLYDRALEATKDMNAPYQATDEQIYVSFYSQLWRLVHGTDITVNVWHVEQNNLKPVDERESIKQLCDSQVANIINAEPVR